MHRDSQLRVYGDQIYFITSTTEGGYEYFRHRILCDVWIRELQLSKDMSNMKLFAFCLNYNHFHLLIKPTNKNVNYSKIMQFLKRHSSRNINIILGYTKLKQESDIGQYRLLKDQENAHYRFLYDMNDHDTYIQKLRKEFIREYSRNHTIPKFKWQKSFLDHVIRNKKDLKNHIYYIMYNHLKHGIPKSWRYTGSMHNELLDEFIE